MTFIFFFNDTATTEIYTLSLHDALPICSLTSPASAVEGLQPDLVRLQGSLFVLPDPDLPQSLESYDLSHEQSSSRMRSSDRKSTRLNSSHANISYAVFCLKKKKNILITY